MVTEKRKRVCFVGQVIVQKTEINNNNNKEVSSQTLSK